MKSARKPAKRRQNSPVRLSDEMNKVYRDIAAYEARSIGQVVDASLRFAASQFSKEEWYNVVGDYMRSD